MQVNRSVIRIRLLFSNVGGGTRGKIVFKLWGHNFILEILFSCIARLLESLLNFSNLKSRCYDKRI